MNEMIKCDIEFEDKTLNELLNCLSHCYNQNQINFAKISFTIYSIWDYCKNNYWKAKNNELYNSYKLLEKFGFDKKAVSRYKCSFERYVQGTTIENVSLKEYTTYKVGGVAHYMIFPKTSRKLACLIRYLKNQDMR